MNVLDKIRQLFRPSLNCEQANRFIMDYLDNRLDGKVRKQFESHLHMCPNCTPFLEQYRQTVRLAHDDGALDVPQEVIEQTLSFLRSHMGPDGSSSDLASA